MESSCFSIVEFLEGLAALLEDLAVNLGMHLFELLMISYSDGFILLITIVVNINCSFIFKQRLMKGAWPSTSTVGLKRLVLALKAVSLQLLAPRSATFTWWCFIRDLQVLLGHHLAIDLFGQA